MKAARVSCRRIPEPNAPNDGTDGGHNIKRFDAPGRALNDDENPNF